MTDRSSVVPSRDAATGDRGISTVVDVAFALVLVSASVLLLAVSLDADGGADADDAAAADRIAETVAGTTAPVEYSLAPAVRASDVDALNDVDPADEERLTRTAHGPTGGLVADAAVANLRVDEEAAPVAPAAGEYERAVDDALSGVLAGSVDRVQVVAVWQPYDGAPLRGRATVGRTPPQNADVESVTMTVPSGLPPVQGDAISGGVPVSWGDLGARSIPDDYREVADAVATAVVEGYLPPAATQRALESSGLERGLVVERYERFAAGLPDADPVDPSFEAHLERPDANATAANAYLIDRLAASLEPDLEAFDSPEAAAHAATTGEVTLIVRTWES